MSLKTFKEEVAAAFIAECAKVTPELGRTELFWCAIACAFTGWLLMGLCTSYMTKGFWNYGLFMLAAGCAGCLVMYQPGDKK